MKKNLTLIFSLIILTALFIEPSLAFKKLGQAGFKFLDVSNGARSAGMGGAYTVLGTDVEASFFNPAGLADMEKTWDFSFNYTSWIADITYNSAAVLYNAGTIGKFGMNFVAPSYPDIQGTRIAANEQGFEDTGNVDVGAFCVGLNYARALTDKFRIGAQMKYASQSLGESMKRRITKTVVNDSLNQYDTTFYNDDNKASTLVYDFGTLFYPKFKNFESFAFGMYVKNFSPQIKYERDEFQLPLSFSLGFAFDVFDLLGEIPPDMRCGFEIDVIHPRDYSDRVHVGAEYVYKEMISVRTGYKFNYDEEGISFGFGYKQKMFRLDYAYGYFGEFDMVNRVSLGITF